MNILEEKKRNFVELDILRVLATLLVVLGHCSYTSMPNAVTIGVVLNDTPMLHETIYTFFEKMTDVIYSFHMPLFFALSGMCYALNEHTEYSLNKFIWKKMQRLLIPFVLVGTLYMVPVYWLAEFYISQEEVLLAETKFLKLEIWGHLWFLPALLENFMAFRILRQIFPKSITPLMLFAFFCYFGGINYFWNLLGGTSDPYRIAFPLKHFIWFVSGYIVYKKQDSVKEYLKSYSTSAMFLISLTVFLINVKWQFLPDIFCTASGCITAYLLAFCLTKTGITNSSVYSILLKYNFSIYLFHDPLNYLIIHDFSKWHWIETFPMLAATSFVGMRTIGVCLASVFIAYILKKSRVYITDKIRVRQSQ